MDGAANQTVGEGGSAPVGFPDPTLLDMTCEDDVRRLAEFGLNPAHLRTLACDSPGVEEDLRRELLGEEATGWRFGEDIQPDVLAAIMNAGVRPLPYTETILHSGHFLTVCPSSGRALKSNGSFAMDLHHIAYRFTGEGPFYLVVGRFHGRRVALCIPSRRLVVTLDVPERGPAISRWVAASMRQLLKASVVHYARFRARIEVEAPRLTLVTGGMGNFGHHVWQELGGMSRLLAAGHLPRVGSVLVGPHLWFKLEQVFPEISGIPQIKCADAQEMLDGGLDQAGTFLRPVGLQITADLRDRLHRAARQALGSDEMDRITRAGARCRLIWVNLRAHNKMWTSQITGYAALLNALHDEYKNIGVVYDGWADTAGIRDEIDGLLNAGIVRHDTLGASIETSLAWAETVTTYVSVVGSGLVINSWLVNKPGIAHANRAHLRQRCFWNSVSRGMVPTTFVEPADVRCDGSLYGNYDFDWRILMPELRRALEMRP